MNSLERIDEATPHLMKNWLPFNQSLLDDLEQTVLDERDAKSDSQLLTSLRTDPALYTYCLVIGAHKNIRVPEIKSLGSQVLAGLRILIKTKKQTIPTHRLYSASKRQRELLRNSITRTTTSAVLAPYFNIDSELAYATNSLREVGLALIAWNYPRIYAQAEEHVKATNPTTVSLSSAVDARLGEMLGFEPSSLAASLAKNSQLSPEVIIGLGDSSEVTEESSQAFLMGSTLRKISEISQVFSLATSSDTCPVSRDKWELYREELLPVLGTSGLLKVRESCTTALKSYAELFPEFIAQPISERLCRAPDKSKTQRYLQNFQIPHCSNELQELLRQLYLKINPTVIAYENVTHLIKHIAPQSGFEHGAVYLVNPSTSSLEPRLILGSPRELVTPIYYRQQEFKQSPIAAAYTGKLPVIECHDNGQLVAIAGILGDIQRVGVLYLEPHAPKESARPISLRAHFKAIQQTLNDCLNLC